uniref:Uncharacterized protein n=1 Tax=Mola mola TaxID=94237 RepID=A0A3Q3W8H9_MOLML
MGVQGFQEYIEKHCPTAVVPEAGPGEYGRRMPTETCWWTPSFNGNIELLVCFNGSLEKGRLHDWVKKKGTPPPKVWFLAPMCMSRCIRLALLRFRVATSRIEDHQLEVITLYRENSLHGLVAYDSENALCNIPHRFSAHALKLSHNSKSLTTNKYLMHEVARQLDLDFITFRLVRYLLVKGNHILRDEDLAAFQWSLLGAEHPLASLKVKILMVICLYVLVCDISCTPQSWLGSPSSHRMVVSHIYGTFLMFPSCSESVLVFDLYSIPFYARAKRHASLRARSADLCVKSLARLRLHTGGLHSAKAQIPSLLSMPTRKHLDITIPPVPAVVPEVLRVAEHRHKKGLMHPYIYHVLTKGEIKLSVTLENEANKDLPSTVQLFRPIRQYVYRVNHWVPILMSLKCCFPDMHVMVKELAAYKGKSPHTPELVEALLWLGKAVKDKNRRMRAFLACMTLAMLNPSNVPMQLLVLCCVLSRILRHNELDAFLAQALSPKLYEPDQLQELKHCCPWMYFDGKLLQSKLRANRETVQLIDICDGQVAEIAAKVEKMLRSILEDLNFPQPPRLPSFPPLPLPYPPPHGMPFYPPIATFYPPAPMMPPQMQGRGITQKTFAFLSLQTLKGISSQGGKLAIAGTVVGQWAGIRSRRGRGCFPVQVVSVDKKKTGQGGSAGISGKYCLCSTCDNNLPYSSYIWAME